MSGSSEAVSDVMNQLKPVSVISAPTLRSGRRDHANSPAATKPQPPSSAKAITSPRSSVKSLLTMMRADRAAHHQGQRADAGQGAVQARHRRSASSASPDSSALATNPRAPLSTASVP